MVDARHPHTPPSAPDGDGVRVIQKVRAAGRFTLGWIVVLAVVVVGGAAMWWLAPQAGDVTDARVAAPPAASPSSPALPPHVVSGTGAPASPLMAITTPRPHSDPSDLASYFRPGDPEPTGAELIEAMHEVGVRTGIGAFNPPGTSPPLEGLAVPEDFELPKGYVRHHQSTDSGVSIEPILMFAPDVTLFDPDGRPIAMPGNRVVPPELAPPGLPLRRVRIPPG